jgi:hypothetical protein
MGVTMWKDY